MGYARTTWTDRVVQYPRRYRDELNNQKTFTPDEGTITSAGTAITATNMNNIEDGVSYSVNSASIYIYKNIGGAL